MAKIDIKWHHIISVILFEEPQAHQSHQKHLKNQQTHNTNIF